MTATEGILSDDIIDICNWRNDLTYHLTWEVREPKCESCGKDYQSGTFFDLHEGIVTRGDVQGWSKRRRGLIFCEVNCFLLCRACHTNWGEVFPREKAWELSCERYGEEVMREWYEGLPWKIRVPRRFWDG